MRWWPTVCKKGDMIRVQAGQIYHYGIFVSEDEVIQFGPSPISNAYTDSSEITVISTDIDAFCEGMIVEVAEPETPNEKRRFSPSKTVNTARSRLGKGGYDLIHNNCEHFAYECLYGIKQSQQVDEVRSRWNKRIMVNVYVLPTENITVTGSVYPDERSKEISSASGNLRILKYASWKALEKGLFHAFGQTSEEFKFTKCDNGKWNISEHYISISHSKNLVAVAISNAAVGVDVEAVNDFSGKFGTISLDVFSKEICTQQELQKYSDLNIQQCLSLWTKKESIFKCHGNGKFIPNKIDSDINNVKTVIFDFEKTYILSVSGEQISNLSCYLLGEERPCLIDTKKM